MLLKIAAKVGIFYQLCNASTQVFFNTSFPIDVRTSQGLSYRPKQNKLANRITVQRIDGLKTAKSR